MPNRELRDVLRDLTTLSLPIRGLVEELGHFSVASGQLVVLTSADVIRVLDRYVQGQISVDDLFDWAEAVSQSPEIGLEPDARLLPRLLRDLNLAVGDDDARPIAEEWRVRLARADAVANLDRFIREEITLGDLLDWAEAVASRGDVGLGSDTRRLRKLLLDLSPDGPYQDVTRSMAEQWRSRLANPSNLIDDLSVRDVLAEAWPELAGPLDRFDADAIQNVFVYSEMSAIAGYLARQLRAGQVAMLPAVFAAVERCLVSGTDEAKSLVIVGLLEDLQNSNITGIADYSIWKPYLLPESAKAWQALIDFWEGKPVQPKPAGGLRE